MQYYFAPMEGLTDTLFRRAHHDAYPGCTKYFIPFICPSHSLKLTKREQKAVSPAENAGIRAVPQLLTRDPEHFLGICEILRDLGYREVNLNLGCPSGTVTAKMKGSGLLRDLEGLEALLDAVYTRSPLPVSIKTRIGYASPAEWPALLALFARYPIHELIIHPRTRSQFYNGHPHPELCEAAFETVRFPIVYNGDLFTPGDCREIMDRFPGLSGIMMGRGLLANPALVRTLSGGKPITAEELYGFYENLERLYSEIWPPQPTLGHLHEYMYYVVRMFEHSEKAAKAIRKACTLPAYEDAVKTLFDTCAMKEDPGFAPYL